MDYFSGRNKFAVFQPVVEDAPKWLRVSFCNQVLPMAWQVFSEGWLYSRFCLIAKSIPQYSGHDIRVYQAETRKLLIACEWYRFFDFIELVGREMKSKSRKAFDGYQATVNELFERGEVGWRLDADSNLVQAIPAAIGERMRDVGTDLMKHFFPAAEHYQKAIKFIYGRPPDPENGIKEIVSAVESVGRVIYPSASTLGDVVKSMRGEDSFPPMLLSMIEKFYGYANSEPAVRHGGNVASRVMRADSELSLVVGIGLIQYLLSKKRPDIFLADITDSTGSFS